MAMRIANTSFDAGFGNQGSWSHSSFSDESTREPFFFLQRGILLAISFHYFTTSLTHSLTHSLKLPQWIQQFSVRVRDTRRTNRRNCRRRNSTCGNASDKKNVVTVSAKKIRDDSKHQKPKKEQGFKEDHALNSNQSVKTTTRRSHRMNESGTRTVLAL
mmetsp:Transcript_14170/g.39642  ORF Transcript_14170/g.39642 Transcript_14170/m.39642 type:complete len:159 (+) Transcript_14170:84-560(+)